MWIVYDLRGEQHDILDLFIIYDMIYDIILYIILMPLLSDTYEHMHHTLHFQCILYLMPLT